jgi:hypothetical protein
MSSIPRPSALRVGTTPPASAAPTDGAAPQARARDEGPARGPQGRGPHGEPARAPDVRWTPGGDGEARAMRDGAGYGGSRGAGGAGAAGGANGAGGAGGVGGLMADAWGEHIEALGRWCRSDWPLSATGRSAAASLALAMGLRLGAPGGGNGRGALGEVVRLLLAAAQADVASLRAALADPRAPGARTLLARIVGAPWLLATVRLRGSTVEGTELRACVSREEAAALLTALAGVAGDGPVPALRAIVTGWVRGAHRDAPLLGEGDAVDVPLAGPDETQLLVLPLLALDGAVPAEPPAAVLAALGGLAAPRAATPFLEESDPRAVGLPTRVARDEDAADAAEDEDRDDEDREDDAPDADADDAASDDASDAHGGGAGDEDAPADALPLAVGVAVEAPTIAATSAPTIAPADGPEPVEAEVMAAALARLRARRSAVQHVEATISSDDGVVEHVADVVPWLADASTVELRALARDGWTGDEAIEMARAMADDDPEIAEVVRHVRRTEGELIVEIDGRAASAWLRANRPELAERLDDLLDDPDADA